MLHFQSADWQVFFAGWMHVLHTKGLHAFQQPFSDYNFPYLFLLWVVDHLGLGSLLAVKLLSVVIDAALATGAGLLAHQLWPQVRAVSAAAVVFALPTVMLNGALWGQSDGLYTSVAVFAILFACRGRWTLAGALLGAALAVKLQTIFVAPPLLLLWWHRDRRPWSIAAAFASFLILTLPPVLFGRSLPSVLGTYRTQTHEYAALTNNAPNLYQWWPWSYHAGNLTATVLTVIALVSIGCLGTRRWTRATTSGPAFARGTVAYCCFAAALLPFVLPRMHERYFYIAEVLAVILAFGCRAGLLAAGLLQVATLLAYAPFLTQRTVLPLPVAAMATLGSIAALAFVVWRGRAEITQAARDNGATPDARGRHRAPVSPRAAAL
jgi:Gpi18-like mannosyltransferase